MRGTNSRSRTVVRQWNVRCIALGCAGIVAMGCATKPHSTANPTRDESTETSGTAFRFSTLPPVPDAHGFAGPYVGNSHGALIIAGGANFPGDPPWKGGTKAWYDAGYVLPAGETNWRKLDGVVPSPRGYGASFSYASGVACFGGVDATKCYADCFTLEWRAGKLLKRDLPPLPTASANFAAAAIGSVVYVACGQESPTATVALNRVLSIDLSSSRPSWRELPPLPGPGRILPVMAAAGDSIYVISGASLAPDAAGKPARTYLSDAYRYRAGEGWKRIADVPHPVVAAPSPAIPFENGFAIFGGDSGADVNFEPKDKHPGFSRDILAYDPAKNAWRVAGQLPLGQVTTSVVPFGRNFVVPNGEIRPAVRTPVVTVVTPRAEAKR